jgi:diketogulonate reductase-like aldo/keto reductase
MGTSEVGNKGGISMQNEAVPAVNQIETNPFCQQIESAKLMEEYHV